jgi:hypothetical protein
LVSASTPGTPGCGVYGGHVGGTKTSGVVSTGGEAVVVEAGANVVVGAARVVVGSGSVVVVAGRVVVSASVVCGAVSRVADTAVTAASEHAESAASATISLGRRRAIACGVSRVYLGAANDSTGLQASDVSRR